MKTFTIADIRSWKPCYDPACHLPENWQGTALNILRHDKIPAEDKLWVVCREDLIDAKTLRLFAVWCARQVQHLMTDPRSIAALDVAERFAHGAATKEELVAAWAAARAAWNASRDAGAAEAAASETTSDTAVDAAREAARAASLEAAWDAARAATRDALPADRGTVWDTAWNAALAATREAAQAAQISKLIEMLEGSETCIL